jgi:hypothetical protein
MMKRVCFELKPKRPLPIAANATLLILFYCMDIHSTQILAVLDSALGGLMISLDVNPSGQLNLNQLSVR